MPARPPAPLTVGSVAERRDVQFTAEWSAAAHRWQQLAVSGHTAECTPWAAADEGTVGAAESADTGGSGASAPAQGSTGCWDSCTAGSSGNNKTLCYPYDEWNIIINKCTKYVVRLPFNCLIRYRSKIYKSN